MKAADELAKHVGVKPKCAALEVSRSTLYRRRGPTGQQQPRPTPARALSETERWRGLRHAVISERFVDRSPAEVVATLLDEEVYLCSELHDVSCSGLRGAGSGTPGAAHPSRVQEARVDGHGAEPGVVLTISRGCSGRRSGAITYLYVIMDIYSRYVVGWHGGGPGELGPGRPVDPAGAA